MNKDIKLVNTEDVEKIAARSHTTPKKTFVRRKRKRLSESSDTENEEDIIDKAIDESIKAVAAKNAMTPDVVKKILKKLVLNEHVLAIVKLKEEEEEDSERKQLSKTKNTLKLTRSKARELNQKPFPITPYKNPEPDSEVTALIHNDIVSDDEDAEYEPNEDDIHSDDNTTISDIDSQPMTPATPKSCLTDTDCDDIGCSYTEDGVFKIPHHKDKDTISTTEQENIARRTRSKLCLQTTSIEAIESTFIPPDITTDMYDFDTDIDNVWKDFLTEFTQPLKTNNEEDDEADPEYVACDNETVDEEELRQVRVSKKELSDLVTELFDMVGNIDETLLEDDVQPEIFDVDTPKLPEEEKSSFQPTNASTPTTSEAISKISAISCQVSSATPPPIFVQNPNNINELIPIQNFDFVSNTCKHSDGIIKLETTTSSMLESSSNHSINLTDDLKHVRIVRNLPFARHMRAASNFDYSKPAGPVAVKTEITEPIGFSEQQLKRLQEQMRIHVQLLTQNFIQIYAHPTHWHHANKFKKELRELEDNRKDSNSAFNAWNLDLAVQFCEDWETELLRENADNTAFIEERVEMVEREKSRYDRKDFRTQNYLKFPKKILSAVMTSKVFLYPELLPVKPFKSFSNKSDLSQHEEYLIANALANCTKKLQDILRKYQAKPRQPALLEVCREVVRSLCPFRKAADLYQSIRHRKHPSYAINPIKFFFMHNQVPSLTPNEVIDLDFSNIHPPLYYPDILPPCWKIFRFKRYEKIQVNIKKSSKTPECLWINSQTKELLNETGLSIKEETSINYELTFSDIKPDLSYTSLKNDEESHIKSEQSSLKSFNTFDTDIELSQINRPLSPPSISFAQRSTSVTRSCSCCLDCLKYKQKRKQRHFRSKLKTKAFKRRIKSTLSIGSQDTRRNLKKLALRLKLKLNQFILESNTDYDNQNFWSLIQHQPVLVTVYKHTKAIDIYSSLLVDLKTMASNAAKRSSEGEIEAGVKKVKAQESAEEISVKPETNKKPPKKYGAATNKCDSNEEKDYLFANNFFEKVEETLMKDNKIEEYQKFLYFLQNFDPTKERVSDMFHKIENLLAPNYPELVGLFLVFLLPGQAAEVGRFFEYFIVNNMSTFLEKLNIYYHKQPTQIKKILLSLTELSEEENVTMDQVKAKILPLLRGNQLLQDWFLKLFPNESPDVEDLDDFETLHLNKKTLNYEQIDTSEVYEELLSTDITSDLVEPTCGVKYMNGRIMYGVPPKLLPAKLSFLVQEGIEKSKKIDGIASTQENGNKCVHAIKQYGDRLLEKNKLNSDSSDINSSHSDVDDGDLDEENEEEPQPSTSDAHPKSAKKKAQKSMESKEIVMESSEDTYKMCDANGLKAHALRLNPRASGEKFEDYAHFLSPTSTSSLANSSDRPTTDDESQSKSPKKVSAKSQHKQKPTSPNINTTSKKSIPKSPNPTKRINFANTTPTHSDSTLATTEPASTVKEELIVEEDVKPTAVIKSDWTRDEDRIILETIQNKISMADDEMEILDTICRALENRRLDDIRTRYEFLKELFLKQAKSK